MKKKLSNQRVRNLVSVSFIYEIELFSKQVYFREKQQVFLKGMSRLKISTFQTFKSSSTKKKSFLQLFLSEQQLDVVARGSPE